MSKSYLITYICPSGHQQEMRRRSTTPKDQKYYCHECRKMVAVK